MSAIDEIIGLIPMDQLAGQLGVDPATAEAAARQALPTLIGGMQANASGGGEASLAEAVGQHDPSLVEGGVDLGQVDESDGSKIVGHVFGANHDAVVDQLGGLPGGGGSSLVRRLLPILAPIVMSYLARRLLGGRGGATAAAATGGAGGGLGDVLGQILGGALGGSGGGSGSAGGIDLGSILGNLLGAGRR
jgi:hypothetical protein